MTNDGLPILLIWVTDSAEFFIVVKPVAYLHHQNTSYELGCT